MSFFQGINNAKANENGVYLTDGEYRVEVTRCLGKKTQKSGDGFIAELKVLASSNPDKHPVGSKRTWFVKMSQASAASNLRGFAVAVFGLTEAQNKAQIEAEISPRLQSIFDEATSEKNVFAGRQVQVTVTTVKTQKGTDFGRHDWAPPPKA